MSIKNLSFFPSRYSIYFFDIGLVYTNECPNNQCYNNFFSVFLAHLIYKNDHLIFSKLIGCIVGFIGINLESKQNGVNFSFYGKGFVIISAFLLSALAIYGKELGRHLDVFIVYGYQLSIGGLLMITIDYIFGENMLITSWLLIGLLVFLILNSSVSFARWTFFT